MVQRVGHVNLTSSEFPINFDDFGGAVFYVDSAEHNRLGLNDTSAQVNTSGISQAYFLKDVLPIYRGYSSVDYLKYTNPQNDIPHLNNARIYSFTNGARDTTAIAVAEGFAYYLTTKGWKPAACNSVITNESVCTVKGVTYLFIPNAGIYTFDSKNGVFQLAQTRGINLTINSEIFGMAAVNGVLVLHSATALTYSSVLDPLDFRVIDEDTQLATNTGAGTTSIIAIRGAIVAIRALGTDMIIYTTENAVAGQATGNVLFPWAFREIVGFPGIFSSQNVARECGNGFQVALTPSGFYSVDPTKCVLIWPELFQALARGYFAGLNFSGLPVMKMLGKARVTVTYIAGRFWVVSAGAPNTEMYSTAYVYDELLKRWGKLDIPHVAVFPFSAQFFAPVYTYNMFAQDNTTYDSFPANSIYSKVFRMQDILDIASFEEVIGFLQIAGAVYATRLSTEFSVQRNGLLVLGKFKLVRNGGSCLQSILAHGIYNANISAFGHGYDGDIQRTNKKLIPLQSADGRCFGRVSGDCISVAISGSFRLTDFSIYASDAGKINTQQAKEHLGVTVAGTQVAVNGIPVIITGV